jgi:hypothetical protein
MHIRNIYTIFFKCSFFYGKERTKEIHPAPQALLRRTSIAVVVVAAASKTRPALI